MSKIIEWKNVEFEKKGWFDKKTVLVGGCFEIFHYGHLKFLQQAKKQGNFLIVVLEPDRFIQEKKNKNPIHNQIERAEILAAIEIVDVIILLPYFKKDSDYFVMVSQIKPKVIAVTENDNQIDNKKTQAAAINGKVITVANLISRFSSSKILKQTL